ncbi:MAG TPA: hypothetical protein DIW17_01455 [Clostridiales bacterium]|nr:hypothetical protein [Clostridiales bacterium]
MDMLLKQLNYAIAYIESNLCEEIDLDTVARIACGWEYALELAPYCNFGAEAETGALMARPARKR